MSTTICLTFLLMFRIIIIAEYIETTHTPMGETSYKGEIFIPYIRFVRDQVPF